MCFSFSSSYKIESENFQNMINTLNNSDSLGHVVGWFRFRFATRHGSKCIYSENTPIQIYWKFYNKKGKLSDKITDSFHISAQTIDCEYSLEPPRRGGSNGYPPSMFV